MSKKEFGITVFTLVFAILAFALMPFQTVGTRFSSFRTGTSLTPRTFPTFTAGLMGILSIIHLFQLIKLGQACKSAGGTFFVEDADESGSKTWPIFLVCCIMILYVLVMKKIGFILDTVILCVLISVYMKSKWWQVLISGVAAPIVLYYLFRMVYVYMPSGTIW